MIDLDRLEQRLEHSLTEDLRVYRAGRARAGQPDEPIRPERGEAEAPGAPRPEPRVSRPEPRVSRPEPRRPEIRAESRAVVRPEPWREAGPEPPRERRRELRRERRRERRKAEEQPPLDPGFLVIRPQARPAPSPAPRWDRLPEPDPEPLPFVPAPAAAPRPSPVRPEAPPAGVAPPHHVRRFDPEPDLAAEPRFDLAGHAARAAQLLAEGDRAGAEHHVAAHAALAAGRGGTAARDAAALATMVALLDGREAEARSGNDAVLLLGREADDRQALDLYWAQRLWIVLEWGREDEHGELLDYCRERAYHDGDTAWTGAIALLLARSGGHDEARAAFDAASRALETAPANTPRRGVAPPAWLDLATDLAEAAALLGDAARAATVTRALARTAVPSVAIGRGWVCKGATARHRGLLAAALGRWDEADREYRAAIDVQRRLEAGPLLARTLVEWGRVLQGRDDLRSRSYLQEGTELGRRLALADFLARSGERAS